jgi:uncharacterized membrane protein
MGYRKALAWGSVLALSAGAVYLWTREEDRGASDDAPGRTARRKDFNGFTIAGRAVTIREAPETIHAALRDPATLSRIFGGEATCVWLGPEEMEWTVPTPLGDTAIRLRLVSDRNGEVLAWRSVDGASVDMEAKVQLRRTEPDRGTVVEAHVAWRPLLGMAGALAARMVGSDPGTLCTHALKRLKMLLETGEIAIATERRAA